MEKIMKNVVVFAYNEPFSYIRDCQKAGLYPWTESYRKIAKKFDLGGAYFWLVIHGKKPFPRKIIDGLVPQLKLGKSEATYFKLLAYLSTLDIENGLKTDILNKFRPAKYRRTGKKTSRR
jgi:hypothetical protein